MPLNYLFADKLTTMGCETIGVQNARMDEQVKQFYDIMMLAKYCITEMDCSIVREKYLELSVAEWFVRKHTECDMNDVIADVNNLDEIENALSVSSE